MCLSRVRGGRKDTEVAEADGGGGCVRHVKAARRPCSVLRGSVVTWYVLVCSAATTIGSAAVVVRLWLGAGPWDAGNKVPRYVLTAVLGVVAAASICVSVMVTAALVDGGRSSGEDGRDEEVCLCCAERGV
jgi:hypothetical protein